MNRGLFSAGVLLLAVELQSCAGFPDTHRNSRAMRDARNIAITFNHARIADNRTSFANAADAITAVTSGRGISGGGNFADTRFFVGLPPGKIAEASRLIGSTGKGDHLKLTIHGSVVE